jgi:hypothetical protein|nr:MAG TPA_asm: hypothetical protein [Caudoviricetes sp.]
MTRTNNYDLIVVEGSDKVNLLTQMNPNTEKIDEVMKANENSGVHTATELLSGSVHAITRTVKTASMFKFTAVSNYTAGDTFTVDGVQVTALLTSGEALGTGAYIIGSEVLCSLKDTLLTVYTQGGTIKLAEDSEKLGGNLPEYYAKQTELDIVKNTADSASSLSRLTDEKLKNITEKKNIIFVAENSFIPRRNNYVVEEGDVITFNFNGGITCIKNRITKIGTVNKTFKNQHKVYAYVNANIEFLVDPDGQIYVYSYDVPLNNIDVTVTLTFIDNV